MPAPETRVLYARKVDRCDVPGQPAGDARLISIAEHDDRQPLINEALELGGEALGAASVADSAVAAVAAQTPAQAVILRLAIRELHRRPDLLQDRPAKELVLADGRVQLRQVHDGRSQSAVSGDGSLGTLPVSVIPE